MSSVSRLGSAPGRRNNAIYGTKAERHPLEFLEMLDGERHACADASKVHVDLVRPGDRPALTADQGQACQRLRIATEAVSDYADHLPRQPGEKRGDLVLASHWHQAGEALGCR